MKIRKKENEESTTEDNRSRTEFGAQMDRFKTEN